MTKLWLGSHVSYNGSSNYLVGSVEESISYGSNCFMVYTGPPQNTLRKDIDKNNVEQAHKLMEQNGIDKSKVIVHAPYIINLASPKDDTYELAVSFLAKELKRVEQFGFKYLVLHPGSRLDLPLEDGIKKIINGINHAFKQVKNNVIICLETMAGKGSEVGSHFEEIKAIIDGVEDKSRIGVCLDTCHVWESGIDISDPKKVLKLFDEKIGLNYLYAIHLNGSKNGIGAHKDRHENIGYGPIEFDTIIKWCYCKDIEDIPKILETPYYDVNGKSLPPYKIEIEMINQKQWHDFKNEG